MPPNSPSPEITYNWMAIYVIVAGTLVIEIATFALLGWIYR